MLLAEEHSEALWEGYFELLQSGPHWLFEITLMLIFDVLIGLILWPLIKKAVRRHDREVHHTNSEEYIKTLEARIVALESK